MFKKGKKYKYLNYSVIYECVHVERDFVTFRNECTDGKYRPHSLTGPDLKEHGWKEYKEPVKHKGFVGVYTDGKQISFSKVKKKKSDLALTLGYSWQLRKTIEFEFLEDWD